MNENSRLKNKTKYVFIRNELTTQYYVNQYYKYIYVGKYMLY